MKASTPAPAVVSQATTLSTAPSSTVPPAIMLHWVTFSTIVRTYSADNQDGVDLLLPPSNHRIQSIGQSWRPFPRKSVTAMMQIKAQAEKSSDQDEDSECRGKEYQQQQMAWHRPPPLLPLPVLLHPEENKSSLLQLMHYYNRCPTFRHAIQLVSSTGLAAIERALCLRAILQVLLYRRLGGSFRDSVLELTWIQARYPPSLYGFKADSMTCAETNTRMVQRVKSSINSITDRPNHLDQRKSSLSILTFHHWMEQPDRERIFRLEVSPPWRFELQICLSPHLVYSPNDYMPLFFYE